MDNNFSWAPWTSNMLDESVIESLRPIMHMKKYAKGEIIYCQGDYSNVIYLLLEGIVEIGVINPDGRKRIITIHEAKCIFGETIFADQGYISTVTCLKPVTVGIIDISMLKRSDPHNQLLLAIIRSLSKKLIIASGQLGIESYDNVIDRVQRLLESLATEHGVNSHDTIIVELPLTHQMIADIIGSTRARVSQSLGYLRTKKNISISKKNAQKIRCIVGQERVCKL